MTAATQLSPNMNGAAVFEWALTGANAGDAIDLFGYGDKGIIFNSAGAYGATLTLQGSMDGVIWGALKDADGNAITASTGTVGILAIREPARYYRVANGGTLGAAVTVQLFAKGV